METEDQNRYLQPLKQDARFIILRQIVLDSCNPDTTLQGKNLEMEMLRFGFMREGVELVFNTVGTIPEVIEDENEY